MPLYKGGGKGARSTMERGVHHPIVHLPQANTWSRDQPHHVGVACCFHSLARVNAGTRNPPPLRCSPSASLLSHLLVLHVPERNHGRKSCSTLAAFHIHCESLFHFIPKLLIFIKKISLHTIISLLFNLQLKLLGISSYI
jgi:hypothetical protein